MKRLVAMLMTAMVMTLSVLTPISASAKEKGPEMLTGKLSDKLTKDISGSMKFLNDNKDKFNLQDASKEFSQKSSSNDSLGYTHIKLQQMVDGIPVFGNEYIIHFNKNGEVYAVNGTYEPEAREFKKTGEFIGESEALKFVKNEINYDENSIIKDAQNNLSPKLYLYKVNNEYVPVYLVRAAFLEPEPGDWFVFVNAYDGSIVNKYNTVQAAAATGSGTGVLNDTKSLNLDKITSSGRTKYYMRDLTRGARITTYTCQNGTSTPGSLLYSTTSVINDKAAVDAHYYAGIVYDYYRNKFNRNSINGSGMEIKSSVHYRRNWVNAAWVGTQMVYGDGDGTQSLALSGALDVIGHEMTHGVDSYEANLTYQNQSGALNESMSDAFGTFIEYYAQPNNFDWLCGEDVWTPRTPGDALRDLANPTRYNQPDHMSDYVNTTSDNGGVHTNSGIPNKACYLIASQIGIPKAEQIYYRALTVYLTSSSNFHAARLALAQAAADLYGANGTEVNTVNSAFTSVGVQ